MSPLGYKIFYKFSIYKVFDEDSLKRDAKALKDKFKDWSNFFPWTIGNSIL